MKKHQFLILYLSIFFIVGCSSDDPKVNAEKAGKEYCEQTELVIQYLRIKQDLVRTYEKELDKDGGRVVDNWEEHARLLNEVFEIAKKMKHYKYYSALTDRGTWGFYSNLSLPIAIAEKYRAYSYTFTESQRDQEYWMEDFEDYFEDYIEDNCRRNEKKITKEIEKYLSLQSDYFED